MIANFVNIGIISELKPMIEARSIEDRKENFNIFTKTIEKVFVVDILCFLYTKKRNYQLSDSE